MALKKEQKNVVRRGQIWRKRDTQCEVEILRKVGSIRWQTAKVNRRTPNASHIMTEYDLHKWYELVS